MSRRRQIRTGLAACVFLFLAVVSAQAAPLAPAAVAGQVSFSNPPAGIQVTAFGTFPLSGSSGSLQFAASATPAPSLSASATLIPFFFGRASGTLVYEIEILGPAGDVPVSITVSGAVAGSSDSLSGDSFAGFAMQSLWSLETTGGTPLVQDGISTPSLTGSFSQSFAQTHQVILTANRVYRVRMSADAGARAGSATAFIDPVFSFGSGVDPELYSFLLSDGIGNAPEPASLALIAAGLVGVGLRRALSRSR